MVNLDTVFGSGAFAGSAKATAHLVQFFTATAKMSSTWTKFASTAASIYGSSAVIVGGVVTMFGIFDGLDAMRDSKNFRTQVYGGITYAAFVIPETALKSAIWPVWGAKLLYDRKALPYQDLFASKQRNC